MCSLLLQNHTREIRTFEGEGDQKSSTLTDLYLIPMALEGSQTQETTQVPGK